MFAAEGGIRSLRSLRPEWIDSRSNIRRKVSETFFLVFVIEDFFLLDTSEQGRGGGNPQTPTVPDFLEGRKLINGRKAFCNESRQHKKFKN